VQIYRYLNQIGANAMPFFDKKAVNRFVDQIVVYLGVTVLVGFYVGVGFGGLWLLIAVVKWMWKHS